MAPYDPLAVNRAIAASRVPIRPREARLIHALLRGREPLAQAAAAASPAPRPAEGVPQAMAMTRQGLADRPPDGATVAILVPVRPGWDDLDHRAARYHADRDRYVELAGDGCGPGHDARFTKWAPWQQPETDTSPCRD